MSADARKPAPTDAHPDPSVAIVGIGCLFPKAPDLTAYWRNVLAGADALSDVPEGHSWSTDDYYDPDPAAPDKTWATRGGFLDRYPFDPMKFGIPPAMLESIDTTQLLSLVVAREALRDAGLDPDADTWNRDRVSCIVGITGTQEMAITAGSRLQGPIWRRSLLRCGVDPALADVIVKDIANHFPTWTEQTFPGLLGNVVAGRIANRLDLGGTNAVVDAACASSLAAVQYAIGDLLAGRSDLVLTGGSDTLNDIFMFECFTRTPAFSRSGDARPFDASADGILIGEGIALVALKRLADAERDGDRVYAVIRAVGSSSDGRYKSIYAPNPDGQAKALRRTYTSAGVDPSTVELVEAHGTGTKAGDAAEIEALKRVYREARGEGRWVALGSVKAQIGHTKSTAGAAGLVKAAMALHQRVLPPAAKIERPNPKMGFEDSPFYLSPRARPWIRAADHPRRAAVSAFGFGGSNFHALLEEHGPDLVAAQAPATTELFLLSADDEASLDRALVDLGGPTLTHASRAANRSFRAGAKHVVAFVASSLEDLPARVEAARRLLRGEPARPKDDCWVGTGGVEGRVALLFPGQGSQVVEMGRDLAVRYPGVRAALDRADEHFRAAGQPPLSSRTFPPPSWTEQETLAQVEALRATEWAQPALGAHAVGVTRLLASFGVVPDVVAGHSYGELPALWAAGAIDEEALLRLSCERGRLMAGNGADRGTMAAVDAPLEAVDALVAELGDPELTLANRNHPSQAVLSGSREAVAHAVRACGERGWKAKEIPVSAAFHSPLVADARAPFRTALATTDVRSPTTTVLSCADGAPFPAEPEAVKDRLADQLCATVDWVAVVESAWAAGVRTFVEVGPRGVLTGLVEATLARGGRRALVLSVDRAGDDGDADLKRALARLAAAGIALDPSPLLAEREPPVPPIATPRTVWIAGANHRNPETLEPPMPKLPPPPTDGGWGSVPSSGRPMERPVHLDADRSIRLDVPPAAPVPAAVPVAAPSADVLALLESTRATLAAFQDAQARTAEVHGKFLDGFARANENFARLFEAQARLIEQVAGIPGAPQVARPAAPAPVAAPLPTRPAPVAAAPRPISAPSPLDLGRVLLPNADRPAVATDMPPLFDALAAVLAKGRAPIAPPQVPVTRAGKGAVTDAMLDAVAEKTGYPRDALELSMDLESDLGVDSIKRVEILSAVRDRVPGLPELDNDRLGAMRTLQEVVAALAEVPSALEVAPILVAHRPPSRDALVGALLEAVADKTGYPRDALELSMDLESDLGVDSIKRVEILSAVRDRIPELPELDNDVLGSLRTLRDVADHLGGVAVGLGFAHIGSEVKNAGSPALLVPDGSSPRPAAVGSATPAPALPPVQGLGELVMNPPARRSLRRRSLVIVPAPPARPLRAEGPVVVIPGTGDLAERLATALRTRGVVVSVADTVPPGTWGVVYAAAVGAGEDLRARVREGFLVARASGPVPRFVTLSDLDGRLGRASAVGRPLVGALGGLAKTLALEWPESRVSALDLGPDTDPERVADEILSWRAVVELGLDGGVTLAERHDPEPSEAFPLHDGDLCVVSGGARGVTAACVRALAGRVKPAFLLLGRSPISGEPRASSRGTTGVGGALPLADSPSDGEPPWARGAPDSELVARRLSAARAAGERIRPRDAEAEAARIRAGREADTTVRDLRAGGCVVRYAAVDGRDASAVAAEVAAAVAEHGPVRALVHGMGVLADRRVEDKTPEHFDLVFDTKWDGLVALLAAVDPAALRVLVAFTSVAGRYGNVGQVDYAMANEALVHALLDHQRRHPTTRVKAFDWGPWDGGMVDASLKAVFEARGHGVLPLREGAELFVDELGRPEPEVVVEAALPNRGARVVHLDPSAPWLADHRLDRVAVLPLAMTLEWLVALGRDLAPGRSVEVRDLRVLRGVKLDGGDRQLGLAWDRDGDRVVVELRGEDGVVHHRASLIFGAPRAPERFPGSNGLACDPLSVPVGQLYGTWLFHGPALQALEEVVGTSDEGAVARLRTSRPADLGIVLDRWATDPVCVDGVLQLLLVWVRRRFGTAALPMAVGSWLQLAPLSGVVTCHLTIAPGATASAGRFSAILVDGSGRVLARCAGGEYATTPSLVSAFANTSPVP